jgi:hypothetical protein
MRFKVMCDLDGRYVLTATIMNDLGHHGFWFGDYRFRNALAAWSSLDRPI